MTGPGDPTGAALVSHPQVDKVAFTGSTATGLKIAGIAAARNARVSLEMGGKSPNIVFADADLSNAANGIMAGIFAATGQSCMAGSRVLVQDTVYVIPSIPRLNWDRSPQDSNWQRSCLISNLPKKQGWNA